MIRASLFRWIIGFFLFFFFALRFWLAATNKPFWADESAGFIAFINKDYIQLLRSGTGEPNPSPLYFLFNRGIYSLYNYQPQLWWDLRLFNRILPAVYWAIACVGVFFWISHRSQSFLKVNFWTSLILGISTGIFLHSCPFMNTYAIEDRPYALWVSFSTFQILAWLELMLDDSNRGAWYRYGFFSALLCFTTFSALGQVLLGGFMLLLSRVLLPPFRLSSSISRIQLLKYLCIIFCISAPFSLYYYFQAPRQFWDPKVFQLSFFVQTILEVITKTFHHHTVSSLALTLPLFIVVLPWFFRKQALLLWLVVYNIALLFLALLFFKGSQWSGGLWAPRYVIFLIPSYFILYLAGLMAIAEGLAKCIRKKLRISSAQLLLIWSIAVGGATVKGYLKEIQHNWPRIHARNVFGFTKSSDCPKDIKNIRYEASEIERTNDICRSIPPPRP